MPGLDYSAPPDRPLAWVQEAALGEVAVPSGETYPLFPDRSSRWGQGAGA